MTTPTPDLRELLAKATPGPWEYESDREGSSMGWIGHQIPAGRGTVFSSMFEVEGDSAQQVINAELAVEAVNALPSLLDTIARLEAGLTAIVNGDVPRPIGEQWRLDGKASKHDRCTHGHWLYEDCGACIADFAARTLTPETDHDE